MADKNFEKIDDEQAKTTKFFHKIANTIIQDHSLVYCAEGYYEYTNGVYSLRYDMEVRQWIMALVGNRYKSHTANEIIAVIKPKIFKRPEELNSTNLINLKNGMLDLSKSEAEFISHDPKYLSTIQLNIDYDCAAYSPLWYKTINEILHKDDIKTLQEFFGLCLTKDTSYQKALFMVGEGANGKGVITHILERLVGLKNRSCVEIEKLGDDRLVAGLYGKLINISTETSAKGFIHDSIFKTIVVGESIQANPKYKTPFEFTPFCKMIISTNNMPRTNDTSYALYRRMLIIPFERLFKGTSDNKQLRFQLEKELSGILLWAIYGLKRLRENKCFTISDKSEDYQEEYKKENNTVLMFVDECCFLDDDNQVDAGSLYDEYNKWCHKSGYNYPLGKNNFGKELLRQYKGKVEKKKTGSSRKWKGIGVGHLF